MHIDIDNPTSWGGGGGALIAAPVNNIHRFTVHG